MPVKAPMPQPKLKLTSLVLGRFLTTKNKCAVLCRKRSLGLSIISHLSKALGMQDSSCLTKFGSI